MARPLRILYPDAVYHVTCRGNEKQIIFRDDADRNRFLQQLNQSVNIYTVKLHSLKNTRGRKILGDVDTGHAMNAGYQRPYAVTTDYLAGSSPARGIIRIPR